jgi:cell division protein FtsL
MATASQRRVKIKKTEKRLTISSYVIIIAIVAFIAMIGILFQHTVITEKNTEIRELQKTLDDAVQVNDSKEGQLVTNMNLQSIEAQARSYGMTEPVQEQYRREVIAGVKDNQTLTDSEKVRNWFENLF